MQHLLCTCALLLTAFARTHNLDVEEAVVERFNYTPGVDNDDIGIQNVTLRHGDLFMRAGIERHALLRWETANETENWAFTFTINDLHLDSDERAGIYLRYTKDKPLIGLFKGGSGEFEGIAVGAEFSGRSVDIVYIENDGEDLSNLDTHETRRDKIDPARFKNVEELTFKVICTPKNLKVEIYDGERLLYDRFRIYKVDKTGANKAGMHFALVSDYPSVSSRKAFILKQARLYKRTESEQYAATTTHVRNLSAAVREKSDIGHYDIEIRELIHKQELVVAYLRTALGELPDTGLAILQKDLLKELETVAERIGRLETARSTASKGEGVGAQLNDLDIKIKKIQGSLSDLAFAVENATRSGPRRYQPLDCFIFALGCVVLCMLAAREWGAFKVAHSRAANK